MNDEKTLTNEQQPVAINEASNTSGYIQSHVSGDEVSSADMTRFKTFFGIQILFLLSSPLAGGFHYKLWSMLDTAIFVLSIGIVVLAFILETSKGRKLAFRTAVFLYILGLFDMSVNILLSGILGWQGGIGLP